MSRSSHRRLTTLLLPFSHVRVLRLFPCRKYQAQSSSEAAAVGTVSVRSLVEPLRKILARLRGHLINAKVRRSCAEDHFDGSITEALEQAIDLVMSQRLVEVELVSASGKKEHVYVP